MNNVIEYYRRKESRWGYKIVLRGVRHFGYYPASKKVSHKEAQILMMDQLGNALNLPNNAKIIDAGCGEGATAIYLSKKYGWDVVGIDLLEESIAVANQNTQSQKNIQFMIGDFDNLPSEDSSIDGIYAIETLTHSKNIETTIKEFHRVLKPGGKLVFLDYETAPLNTVKSTKAKFALKAISRYAAAPGFLKCTFGYYAQVLESLKFKEVETRDITRFVLPMLRLFARLSKLAYVFINMLKLHKYFPNATIGANGLMLAKQGYWKFIIVSGQK